MLKQASVNLNPNQAAEVIFAASRQVWLAGLGAVAVSREWAQKQAGPVFKDLVKQGSGVETQAMRLIGKRIESSIETAEQLWKQARRSVLQGVNSVAEAAAAAVPKLKIRVVAKRVPAAKARSSAKPAKARTSPRNAARAGKRSGKRAR